MSNVPSILEPLLAGDRVALGRGITLVESNKPDHSEQAQALLGACLPFSGKSIRVGITGVPGVGKSTFIEALGKYLIGEGHKVAVLAIDPSSNISGGSILGDKTRMNELSKEDNAFIRPSPSSGSLGGVARKTREAVILCEAAGYDIILIETVGVGQSETAVHSMVDFFLLLALAGAGDELQGMKRGIMELADLVLVNKADDDNLKKAIAAMVDYKNALHLFPPQENGWTPRAATCSAIEGTGIKEAWAVVDEYHRLTVANGHFEKKRATQSRFWLHEQLDRQLLEQFYQHPSIKERLAQLEQEVQEMRTPVTTAVMELLKLYGGKLGGK